MTQGSGIAQLQIEDLIQALGGRSLAAGSGAAGAVTLALAAACAAKAAAITFKHHPENAALGSHQEHLERLARFALAGADEDAEAFAAFIKEQTLGAVTELLRQGNRTLRLIDILSATVESLAPQVDPNMRGDIVAARALLAAARTIQLHNSAEARAQQDQLNRTPS
jgi:Formiminotransferase-cyclodeaminase